MNTTDNRYRSSITWFLSGVNGSIPSSEDNLHLARFVSKLDGVIQSIRDQADVPPVASWNNILKSALELSSVLRDISSGRINMADLLSTFGGLVQSVSSGDIEEGIRKQIDKLIRDAFAELILLAKYSQRADLADEVLMLVKNTYSSVSAELSH